MLISEVCVFKRNTVSMIYEKELRSFIFTLKYYSSVQFMMGIIKGFIYGVERYHLFAPTRQ